MLTGQNQNQVMAESTKKLLSTALIARRELIKAITMQAESESFLTFSNEP